MLLSPFLLPFPPSHLNQDHHFRFSSPSSPRPPFHPPHRARGRCLTTMSSSGPPPHRQLARHILIIGHAVDFLHPQRRSFDLLRGRQIVFRAPPDVSSAPLLPHPLAIRLAVMHVHDELMIDPCPRWKRRPSLPVLEFPVNSPSLHFPHRARG